MDRYEDDANVISKPKLLIIVDVQNDFCEGGSLAVPGANSIIPVINKLSKASDIVIATKDYHPPNHVSFASSHTGAKPFSSIMTTSGFYQMVWPDHCIRNTNGAEFSPLLNTDKLNAVFYKGTDANVESYSAICDCQEKPLLLYYYLKGMGLDRFEDVTVCGIATDYCVDALIRHLYGYSAALQTGIAHIKVHRSSIVGVNQEHCDKLLKEWADAGVEVL